MELRAGARLWPSRSHRRHATLRRHVAELTAQQEQSEAKPWALADAPDTFIEIMLRGIVGCRFAITRLEGKWRMSQNRGTKDREGVGEASASGARATILRSSRWSCGAFRQGR